MEITFNMIVEELTDCTVLHKPNRSTRFDAVFTEPASLEAGKTSDLALNSPKNPLFIGEAEQALEFFAHNPEASALVLLTDDSETNRFNQMRNRACLVDTKGNPQRALAECEKVIARFSIWQSAMKTTLLEGGDYQNILTISEDILKNFVSISDSAFRLLAYTRNIPIDDPIACSLIEHGHHTQETVDLFKRNGIDKVWRKKGGLSINLDSVTKDGATVDYVFKMHGEYFTHAVMHCNNRPVSSGLVDTFAIMADHLMYRVRHDWNAQQRIGSDYGKTVLNLLTGRMHSSVSSDEELRLARIDKTASFIVYVLSFIEEQLMENSHATSYYLFRLIDIMPNEKVVAYDNKVVLLHEMHSVNDQIDSQIIAFQNTYGGLCAASNVISSVYDIPFGYQQACYALNALSNRNAVSFSSHPVNATESNFITFKSLYPNFLLMTSKDDRLLAYCLRQSVTLRIKHDDELRDTNNLEILNAYLIGERRASDVSHQLHMHRNTLVYKIENIQKRYQINLDNVELREALIVEYALMKAMGTYLVPGAPLDAQS